MDKNLSVSASIKIRATAQKVWDALTNPEKIKVYLFGTDVITDWRPESPITFQGEYSGTTYKDKGKVIENKVNTLLQYTYWSNFSGLEDKPENYSFVTYSLEVLDIAYVKFTWHQAGFSSKKNQTHTKDQLKIILNKIKEISEVE